MIELRVFGPLPSRTIVSTVAVRNGNCWRSLFVSNIICAARELPISKRRVIVTNEGLALDLSEAGNKTICNGQGVVDSDQTAVIKVLGSNTETVSRSDGSLEVAQLRKGFRDGGIGGIGCVRHRADQDDVPQDDRLQPQPQTVH